MKKSSIITVISSVILLIASFQACNIHPIDQPEGPSFVALSVDEARAIYNETVRSQETKSNEQKTSFFQRNDHSVLWDAASIRESFTKSMVLVPVETSQRYIIKMHDGQGYYLTESIQSIAVAKSVSTGATGVYNIYYIPLRSCEEGVKDDNPYHHHHDNYMELLTGLDGKILELMKYTDGRSVHYSVRRGDRDIMYIKMMLNLYMKGFYSVPSVDTKSGNVLYTCPVCGEILSDTAVGYVCWSCGWNEYSDINGGELDPGIVIGEPEDSFNDGIGDLIGRDWGNGDDHPGHGSGNDSGGGFIADQDSIARRDSVLNTIAFESDSTEIFVRPMLELLWEDCMGKQIITAICEKEVHFTKTDGVPGSADYHASTVGGVVTKHHISFNFRNPPIPFYVLLEELFHALERQNGYYTGVGMHNINTEIEARIAVYLYAKEHDLIDSLPGYRMSWESSFGEYLREQSDSNYELMVRFLRNPPFSYSEEEYPDYSSHHIMSNVNSLYPCN